MSDEKPTPLSIAQADLDLAHIALRAALPVMRRYVCEYLEGVTVKRDPATIAPSEWDEIAPDIRAIRMATAVLGDYPPDAEGVDSEWLNECLERSRSWVSDEPGVDEPV